MARLSLLGLILVTSLFGCKKTPEKDPPKTSAQLATSPVAAPTQAASQQGNTEIPSSPKTSADFKHVFSKSYGGESNEHIRTMTKTKNGIVALGGFYEDANPFIKKQDNPHKRNGFVTTLNKNGEVAWSLSIGGKQTDTVDALSSDSNNNILCTGLFSDALEFNDGSLRSEGADDVYVASYDKAGNRNWVKTFGGMDVDVPYDLVVDKEDNVYVTGEFRLLSKFLGQSVQSKGESDVFLAKLSPQGNLIWLKAFGSTGEDSGRALALDTQGSLVLVATFSRSIDFGLGALESNGNLDTAIVKFNPQGQTIWNLSYGTNLNDLVYDVTTGPANQIVVAGAFDDTLEIDKNVYETKGKFDALLLQFKTDGSFAWARSMGAKEDDYVARVGVTEDNRVIAAGGFWYNVTWGADSLKSAGDKDVFLTETASDGTPLSAKRFGGEQKDTVKGMVIDNEVALAGTFHYDINFGGTDLIQGEKEKGKLPKSDVFIAKFK